MEPSEFELPKKSIPDDNIIIKAMGGLITKKTKDIAEKNIVTSDDELIKPRWMDNYGIAYDSSS